MNVSLVDGRRDSCLYNMYSNLFYLNCLLQLYKIMKEHKNPKVLSEGILWMVSAVEDFGASHLKLKVCNFLPSPESLPILCFLS